MKDNIDQDKSIDAQWCVDSETSEKVLIDRNTNKIIMRLPKCCENVTDDKVRKRHDK